MDVLNASNTSIAKVVLLYYLLSVSPYTSNLVGKQFQRFIEDNRMAQHSIAFFTLFVLISLESDYSGTQLNMIDVCWYALIGYVWFIFTTKLDMHWNAIVLIMLSALYIVDRNMRLQELDAKSDPNMSNDSKLKIINRNNKYRTIGIASLFVATAVGTVLYSNKKVGQYGGSYDMFAYFFN